MKYRKVIILFSCGKNLWRDRHSIMFEVIACRLVGENARAISRNQATFSHTSPPGSTVRRAEEVNQASRQASLHDVGNKGKYKRLSTERPFKRVVLTIATGRKTRRDILIVRKTFAPEMRSFPEFLTPMAKQKKKKKTWKSEQNRIYLEIEFIRTPNINQDSSIISPRFKSVWRQLVESLSWAKVI